MVDVSTFTMVGVNVHAEITNWGRLSSERQAECYRLMRALSEATDDVYLIQEEP